MACRLVAMAQRRWRRLHGAHLLPLVRADVVFVDAVTQTEREVRKAAAWITVNGRIARLATGRPRRTRTCASIRRTRC